MHSARRCITVPITKPSAWTTGCGLVSAISPETESYFVFDKRKTASRFSSADAKLAGFAVRGLTWFQRQLFISHGLHVAQQPLTSTERRVLQLLLTEKSEKQIADAMGQSPPHNSRLREGDLPQVQCEKPGGADGDMAVARLIVRRTAKPVVTSTLNLGIVPHRPPEEKKCKMAALRYVPVSSSALRRVGLGHLAGGDSPRGSPWNGWGWDCRPHSSQLNRALHAHHHVNSAFQLQSCCQR